MQIVDLARDIGFFLSAFARYIVGNSGSSDLLENAHDFGGEHVFAVGGGNWEVSFPRWTMSYEPYTYPHPLISGSGTGGSGNAPAAPTGLVASVQ
jgi:hypothetical protein